MNGQSMFDLSGKVAIVTGGGGGLGRAFCEGMAEFGADVVCVDCDGEKSQKTIEIIVQFGHRAMPLKIDIADPIQVQNMVDETTARLGRIDILINNAGVTAPATRICETPIEVWDKIMAVDLKGVFLCMRAVLPVMMKQKKGSIINISSGSAFGANRPGVVPQAYSAAKAGVNSLTRTGAIEHARDGIRVNSIAPGMYDTDFGELPGRESEQARRQLFREMIERDVPMGRFAQPSEIKGLAVYLASDASSYVTGQVFIPDGGFLAQI